MIFETVVVGNYYQVNCYILSGDDTKCIIVDPGDEAEKIQHVLDEKGLTPEVIINTHGHADHIGANDAWNVPIWIAKEDAAFLTDPMLNLSALFDKAICSPPATRLLTDGEVCEVCGLIFTVLHTPGHTPGGICLLFDEFVLSGDTLFHGSVGRTDFPYGNGRQIIAAIKNKLMPLDDAYVICPGHGEPSTIGFERKNNYFLR